MNKNFGRGVLVAVLTAAVLLGAYLGIVRFFAEALGRQVRLVVDLDGVKEMAACEKRPLAEVLGRIREAGISAAGVFEETLPDAAAAGELAYAKGSGVLRLKAPLFAPLWRGQALDPDSTYLYIPEARVRARIAGELAWVFGAQAVKPVGQLFLAVDAAEEELRGLGLGIAQAQRKFLAARGFTIVPRLKYDPRYNAGNIGQKISALAGYNLVIFDGDKLPGCPDALPELARALKKHRLKYGAIEIIKQEGSGRLKKLMGAGALRVHSIPRDELEKIDRDEALDRFVRAVRERGVKVIYLRPFLPPQIDAPPVEYNVAYFRELTNRLDATGYRRGSALPGPRLAVKGWQVLILGAGVIVGALFLLESFFPLPLPLVYLLFTAGLGCVFLCGAAGQLLLAQKGLAFLAAAVFPASAVINTFPRHGPVKAAPWRAALMAVVNVLAETSVGIFLMVGLLADSRFMSGVEVFPAVKLALIVPVLLVAFYFLEVKNIKELLATRITLLTALLGVLALAALAVIVARSGNFTLPVPGFEKTFRSWLETLLYVRPRTKEFLIGYPALFLAALYYFRGGRRWLWLLAALGVIAPVDVFNSFSHIHTPLLISLTRTFSGLALGLLAGALAGRLARRWLDKAEN
ncbi:MAG: hypothetical protein JW873_01160 [Candidatus Saganbacteria bacterium]|nr:hypothetical protein [Candidatus Saganbacteria bacterium]